MRDDGSLRALSLLGHEIQALSYARLRSDPVRVFDGLLCVYNTLLEAGMVPLDEQIGRELTGAARAIPSFSHRTSALRELAVLFAQNGELEPAERLLEESHNTLLLVQDTDSQLESLASISEIMALSGEFAKSRRLMEMMHDIEGSTDHARHRLVDSLTRSGRFEEAGKILRSIRNDQTRNIASRTLAVALAHNGRLVRAFSILASHSLDGYIQVLTDMSPAFEKVETRLSIEVLRETARVIGWVRPDWREVYDLFSEPNGGNHRPSRDFSTSEA